MDDLDFIDDDPWELEDEAFWDLLENPDEDAELIKETVKKHKEDDDA